MSFQLPGGLTVAQLIEGLNDVAQLGLPALGPEAALLAPLIATLASDAVAIVNQPTAGQVLVGEVDAEQAAGDAAEDAKFPKG